MKGDYDMESVATPILWIVKLVEQVQSERRSRQPITYTPREEEIYVGGKNVMELPEWSPQELEQRVSPSPPS